MDEDEIVLAYRVIAAQTAKLPLDEIDASIPLEDALGSKEEAQQFLWDALAHAGLTNDEAEDLYDASIGRPIGYGFGEKKRAPDALRVWAPFSKLVAASLARRNWHREKATITSVAMTFHTGKPVMSGIKDDLAFPPTLGGRLQSAFFGPLSWSQRSARQPRSCFMYSMTSSAPGSKRLRTVSSLGWYYGADWPWLIGACRCCSLSDTWSRTPFGVGNALSSVQSPLSPPIIVEPSNSTDLPL